MSARGWALFAAVAVIWGTPYLFIKVAVEEMSPGFVAWSRIALGAALLLPLAWKLGALEGCAGAGGLSSPSPSWRWRSPGP